MFALPSVKSPRTPTSYQPTNLQLAVFGDAIHILSGFGFPIPADPAAHYCHECAQMVRPSPLSDPAQGWITYPCHEQECGSGWHAGDIHSHCDDCYECCSCSTCDICDRYDDDCMCPTCDYYYCTDKELCEGECGYCDSHCQCSYHESPGWQSRGWEITDNNYPSARSITQDDRNAIDPVQAMADFYVTDYVMAVISTGLPGAVHGTGANAGYAGSRALYRDAKVLQDAIVARCDGAFRDYGFAAIGGEIRHHGVVELCGGRTGSWDYWYALGQEYGRVELLADAVTLFGDGSWGSGYGGNVWKVAAETLLLRERGDLDAKTFVDRVFSLQHNGGSLLDKMSWAILQEAYGDVSYCRLIGDAHASSHIGWNVLIPALSDDARQLLARLYGAFVSFLSDRDRDRLGDYLGDAVSA